MRIVLFLLLLVLPVRAQRLVIVGGGEHPPAAMQQFYDWAGASKANILVIPWATSEPDENFQEFAKDFPAGTVMERAPLAPLTAETRARFLDQLSRASAVWFSGGDQVKTMNVLQDRELLEQLRARYRKGVVFGGTSAGCAVMSERMLTGEADLTVIDGRQVEVREGLGLLPKRVIVDQHFLKRQRENRLFGLILLHPDALGMGIDESTALVLEGGQSARVVGKSQIMLVQHQGDPRQLKIHLLPAGTAFRLDDY